MFTLANETEREVAGRLGLNLTDYRALSVLAQLGPVPVGTLAAELGSTAATTTAIVNRLEAHTYVERLRTSGDRRQVHVKATPAASRKIADLMRPLMDATSEHLKTLPAAHQAVVADFLGVALHLMQDHLHTLTEKENP